MQAPLVVAGDVPRPVVDELRSLECQIVDMAPRRGLPAWVQPMFWRFLPALEPVEAVIFRDADSRINAREAVAVGEWLGALLIVPVVVSFSAFRARRSGGMTMLHFGGGALAYAASNGHAPVVEVLQKAGLKKGADMALAYAARSCHEDTVKLLLGNKANVNAKPGGKPALSMAAAGGCESSVRLLLSAGAAVNATDDAGRTALMEAANVGMLSIVQMLLDKGADLDMRNKDGQNAWLIAAMSQKLDIIELFKKLRGTPQP